MNNLIKDMETKVQENGMLRRENEELRRAAASYRRREEELYMWSTAAAAPANSQAEVAAMALPGIPGAIPGRPRPRSWCRASPLARCFAECKQGCTII